MNNRQLDIILPCYNPHDDFIGRLAAHTAELRAAYPDKEIHLILVNDGSTRNFGEAERQALTTALPDIEIIDQIPNQGKGAAVRTGMRASKASHLIYTDYDIPYSITTMREVIDRIYEGYDVVIAIRNQTYYTKLSFLRKIMSHGSKVLNRLILCIKYTDTQGGLKGLSSQAREVMLRTEINDFLFDTEFIVLASRKKLRITEVESILRDGTEMSKMSIKVIFRELRNFSRIAFKRW